MNIVLKIAYDGTRFVGWQKTNLDPKRFPSIEYELEAVLSRILQEPVVLQAASRTDRGVHALGQIVNLHTTKADLNLERLHHSINCLLPADIRVLALYEEPSHFHPTLSNSAKEYHYKIATSTILNPFLRYTHWHFPHTLDVEKMQLAARALVGEHNFRAFRNYRKGLEENDTVRTLFSVTIDQLENECLTIKMIGNNFLYKMARNIAGTLAYVGGDKLPVTAIAELLEHGTRPEAGVTAPACGLTLYKVFYE